MRRVLLALALLALVPAASATYDPCATQNTLVDTPTRDVILSMDASPCVAVEMQVEGQICHQAYWGVDLGVVVLGGAHGCQTILKVDVDACDGAPILWTPYCAMYGNEYWVCGQPVAELCIWGP